MNATAATVLRIAFRNPIEIEPVDPMAPKSVQEAQAAIGDGLERAEGALRATGLTPVQCQHLARIAVVAFLSAFDGESMEAGRVSNTFQDWLEREGWRL